MQRVNPRERLTFIKYSNLTTGGSSGPAGPVIFWMLFKLYTHERWSFQSVSDSTVGDECELRLCRLQNVCVRNQTIHRRTRVRACVCAREQTHTRQLWSHFSCECDFHAELFHLFFEETN